VRIDHQRVVELVLSRCRIALGESPSVLARSVARGELVRIRRGVYISADDWNRADVVERHLYRMRALADVTDGSTVFSHQSAAIAWGLPLIGEPPPTPHVLFPATRSVTRRSGAVLHQQDFVRSVERSGFSVTGLEQTVIDLTASLPVTHGMPSLDFALSKASPRQLDSESLRAWVSENRPFRGVRRVDAALDIATGLGESPLESLSLVRFAECGIPRPKQQVEIETELGSYWVDFYWPDAGVVGEADGRAKYRSPEDLWREKRREDAIRARVNGFARWSWSDIWQPSRVPDRLRAAGL
jgi:hypothetical protein